MMDKKYHVLAGFLVAALVALPAYIDSGNLFAGIWAAVSRDGIAAAFFERQ